MYKSRLGNFGASPCDELEREVTKAQSSAFAPTCSVGPAGQLPAHLCSPGLLKRVNLLAKGLEECKAGGQGSPPDPQPTTPWGTIGLVASLAAAAVVGLVIFRKKL